jgi:hypothetical protein
LKNNKVNNAGITPGVIFVCGGNNMKLYLDSGYPDMKMIHALKAIFLLLYGGRGTGKTYGALQLVIDNKIKFMFMRRTQTQADLINKPDFSPFKPLNIDRGWNITTQPVSKYNAAFYDTVDGVATGAPLGYTCALSTVSNIRGFDASDIDLLIYDEFIPEKHERPLKNEGDAFLNAYETINRNRELKGRPPLKVICLSNSNDLANPIFMTFGLVRKANQMRKNKQEISVDYERGIAMIDMFDSPISKQKKNTALYRATGDNKFSRMALNNEFSGDEMGRIASRPLAEYRPIVAIGEICIYQHKSRREYYVSTHTTGTPPTFGDGDTERARFRRIYSWVWDEYMDNNIEFEEYLCEILLTKAFN